jgi:hypothetical protein
MIAANRRLRPSSDAGMVLLILKGGMQAGLPIGAGAQRRRLKGILIINSMVKLNIASLNPRL